MQPIVIVVELLRVEEGFVYALDLGLAADGFGAGGVSDGFLRVGGGMGEDRVGGVKG